jgi:hypothetical protein
MKINNTEFFIELLADEGKELYNEELGSITDRVTAPLDTDLSKWLEREILEIIE